MPAVRDDRAVLRVLDVVHGFLVVVSAEHEIDTDIGEGAERAGCLSPCRCESSPFTGLWCMTMTRAFSVARRVELGASQLDLLAAQVPDDRDVAQVPRERAWHHALRRC